MKTRHLFKLGIVGLCMLLAVAFGMPRLAAAGGTATSCMNAASGLTMACSSSDLLVAIGSVTNPSTTICKEGSTITEDINVNVKAVNAQGRYDIGLFFNTDGTSGDDAALTGATCQRADFNAADDGSNFINLDGDSCGDDSKDVTIYKTVTVSFKCADTIGNGHADLSFCTGWNNNKNDSSCSSYLDAVPANTPKCICQTVDSGIIVAKPAISVTKDPPTQTIPSGGDATFTITATNTGNVPLDNVDLDSTEKSDCDTLNGPYTDAAMTTLAAAPEPPLAAGDSYYWSCTISGATTNFTNCVTALSEYTYPGDGSPTEIDSTQACADVTVGSLDIQKSANPTTYDHVGQIITYTYTLTNVGGTTVDNITVYDNKTTDESCPQSSLTGGNSMQCTSHYTITQADIDNGSVTNEAYAQFNIGAEGPYDTPNSDATVTAIQNPALSITKKANPTSYQKVGNVINYSYTVTNSGNTTLYSPFTVTDDTIIGNTPDCTFPVSDELAPGDSFPCTASYTITQDDIDNKSVTNTASATALDPHEQTVNSPLVTATVTYGVPALAVPTMTDWGMIFFVFLAGLVSIFYLRKRKKNI